MSQKVNLPFSASRRVGPTVFISGLVSVDENQNIIGDTIEEQTHHVMQAIERQLQANGGSLNSLVKTTVLLTNIDDLARMNEVYREYIKDVEPMPARAAFEVKLAAPDLLVEIEAIGYIE